MSRIKAFRFQWSDAWKNIDEGYDSILETSDNGDVILKFLVNMKPFDIMLKDKEHTFIDKMAFLKEWNNMEYCNSWVCDGTMWSLDFIYNNTIIRSAGTNGYPKEFPYFLHLLHQIYHLPYSDIDKSYSDHIKQYIKHTKISENTELFNSAIYYL